LVASYRCSCHYFYTDFVYDLIIPFSTLFFQDQLKELKTETKEVKELKIETEELKKDLKIETKEVKKDLKKDLEKDWMRPKLN